jgi:type IV pilus assembly protein PilV
VDITAIPARLPARVAGTGGFSLVEVLVALVVLGVGMLGVASLFATSMHAASGAIARMEAVGLAGDLADRIRANRRVGATYMNAGAGTNINCFGPGSKSCSPDELANSDIYWWQRQLGQAIKGGTATGSVNFTPGTPDAYIITVQWAEKEGTQTYTMYFQANE